MKGAELDCLEAHTVLERFIKIYGVEKSDAGGI